MSLAATHIRTALLGLAGVAVTALVLSGVLKSHNHGALGVVGDVSWGTFLAAAFGLIVASAASLVLRRRSRRGA